MAQDFSLVHGLDVADTFILVIRPATIRIILSLAAASGWSLHQLDVKNVFLHGYLSEEVYMEQLPVYTDPSLPNHVCRLQQALYGQKQAPRAWFRFNDSAIFCPAGTVYLLLYVDDMVIIGDNPKLIQSLLAQFSKEFSMKNLGGLHYFLGIEVQKNATGFFLTQAKYALDLLERAQMLESKLITTPTIVCSYQSVDSEDFSDPTFFLYWQGPFKT